MRRAVSLVCLFLLRAVVHGQESAAYRQAYEELRDAVYEYMPLAQIETRFQGAVSILEDESLEDRERLYWLSRLEYMMGRAFQSRGDKKRAAAHYESGLEYARRALELQEFSDGWRMMAENLGQLCLMKDLPFLLANGARGPQYAQRALKADPRNVAAQIFLAAAKIYPPLVAGGNPARGIQMMNEALALQPTEKEDLFNIYSGIGVGLGKLRRNAEAAEWLRKALEIFPNNQYARQEYAKVARW
jgi:tetratricopeptide (TPR) repeat protein